MTDKKIDDGGSAFPVYDNRQVGERLELAECGMTLRDYFAAKALPSVICKRAGDYVCVGGGETIEQFFARSAYKLADAMLSARGR